jgi:poly(glycerol-phosphate) alpha-glucosyltransferase
VVADWCIRRDKPFMMTTHGNFNPIALKVSSWKKWLAKMTFMKPVFDHVTCYQALSEIEYRTLREYGIRKPICVIGNGVELPETKQLKSTEDLIPSSLMGRRTCLYLGRLFPIKGIDRLLRGWGRLHPTDDWQLVIAGDGARAYRTELESIAQQEHCRNVHFIGFVSGETKTSLLRQAEFLVLPSHSEAFAMTPLEAFSNGTPALLTTACGFPEAAAAGAAMVVASSDEAIFEGLRQMLSMSPEILGAMGEKAITLVRDHYSWEKICAQLEEVYAWMLGDSHIPSCLRLD